MPHSQPALDLEGLGDPLLHDRCGLEQHPHVPQVLRHFHQELGILDVVLGQEAVTPADPALEVHVVGGHVRCADAIVDAHARASDRRDHVVARHQLRHPRADLFHDAEALVAEHEKRAALGGFPVLGGVDLLVGAVHADPEDANEDAPAARDVSHGGLGELRKVDRAGPAGEYGDRLHHLRATLRGVHLAGLRRSEGTGHEDVSARE